MYIFYMQWILKDKYVREYEAVNKKFLLFSSLVSLCVYHPKQNQKKKEKNYHNLFILFHQQIITIYFMTKFKITEALGSFCPIPFCVQARDL
jgi:hypothetical protein